VRSQYRRAHSPPNWLFVKNPDDLRRQFHEDVARAVAIVERDYWPSSLDKATMANSFGVPSFGPEWWTDDVRNARQCVREGYQVLVVSVIASVEGDGMRDDFAHLAKLARDAGSDIVEANYSCPNVCGDRIGNYFKIRQLPLLYRKQ
jgi:hypothetical protein